MYSSFLLALILSLSIDHPRSDTPLRHALIPPSSTYHLPLALIPSLLHLSPSSSNNHLPLAIFSHLALILSLSLILFLQHSSSFFSTHPLPPALVLFL